MAKPVPFDEVKTCTRCRQEKPVAAFGVSRQGVGGPVYRTRCRQCQSAAAQQWHWENADRSAANRRRQDLAKYGLTLEQYEVMLDEQGGVCAICGQDEPAAHGRTGKKFLLSVDHCHETGRVRGLLCQKCNRAVGLLGDRVDLLEKAIAYLKGSVSIG